MPFFQLMIFSDLALCQCVAPLPVDWLFCGLNLLPDWFSVHIHSLSYTGVWLDKPDYHSYALPTGPQFSSVCSPHLLRWNPGKLCAQSASEWTGFQASSAAWLWNVCPADGWISTTNDRVSHQRSCQPRHNLKTKLFKFLV